MSKTIPLLKNFDQAKQIGMVILDDDVKIGVNDIISIELVTVGNPSDKKMKVSSFSIIPADGYCRFREENKADIEKFKDIEIVLENPTVEKAEENK